MTAPRQLATVHDYDGLVAAFRARASELNVSRLTIDEVSGLQSGYASKLLATPPIKTVGAASLGPILGALGMAMVLVEDDAQMRRIASRMAVRNTAQVRVLSGGKHIKITLRHLRKIGKRGGKARALKLSSHRRIQIALRAAKVRWKRAKAQRRAKRNALSAQT